MNDGDLTQAEYFSKRLKEELELKGYSREEFSLLTNISKRTIDTYLNKSNPVLPSLDFAVHIAKTLNVSLDYLCGTGVTKEIDYKKPINASTLLKNLYHVIKDTALNIEPIEIIGQNQFVGNKVRFSTTDQYVCMFLQEIANFLDDEIEVNNTINRYKNLYVYKGRLFDKVRYDYLIKTEELMNDYNDYVKQTSDESMEVFESLKKEKGIE